MLERLRRHPGAATIVSILLVGVAWIQCAPPGDGPDETSHYTRMVGLSEGSLFGRAVPADAPLPEVFTGQVLPVQRARVNLESGLYDLDPRAVLAEPCNAFNAIDGSKPFDCAHLDTDNTAPARSYHAKTLPTSYLFPALLSLAGSSAEQKSALGRLGFLLQNLALLAIAAMAAPSLAKRPLAVGIVLLAFTPAATYYLSMISPSGTEWAATVAFAMCFTRMLTEPTRRWVVLAGSTAAVAALSRDLGIFHVLLTMLVGIVAYREQAISLWRSSRSSALWFTAFVAPALAAGAAWRLWVQAPGGTPELSGSVALDFLKHTATLTVFTIGRIGRLATGTGLVVAAVWLVVAAAVFWVAVRNAPRRRATLLAGGLCWLAVNALLEASMRPTGFGVQARFALPLAASTLLIAATLPDTRATLDARDRRLLTMCAWVSAGGLLASMVTMVWRHARGLWNGLPFIDPAWTPLVGWPVTWLLIGLAATAPLLIASLSARRTTDAVGAATP